MRLRQRIRKTEAAVRGEAARRVPFVGLLRLECANPVRVRGLPDTLFSKPAEVLIPVAVKAANCIMTLRLCDACIMLATAMPHQVGRSSLPVPQATLPDIRAIVDAVANTPGKKRLQKRTGFSARRAGYALSAARLLGLLSPKNSWFTLTGPGRRLVRTRPGSDDEREVLFRQVSSSPRIKSVAPGLLSESPPKVGDVVARMITLTGLSRGTADHRARMLLKWRDALVNRRIEFPTNGGANKERGIVLSVRDFAQVRNAEIEFGDLTVLVGPQATGKSLVLQWFKAAFDAAEIFTALKESGHDVRTPANLIDLIFGEGMGSAWHPTTSVTLDGRAIQPSAWRGFKKSDKSKVFFIPAHRALLLAEGWPAPFIKLNADTPVVARLFSQNLYQRFSGRQAASLFPVTRILKEQYRTKIDDAIFHGGKVELEKEGLRYRLRLVYADSHLPFMTWTSGQREFTPLLLGLYHVLPPRKASKLPDIEWVVIEEPEMGLHPQAIAVFMLLVLDLLWRGYRVVVSTHSPLILDIIWAIKRLKEHGARWKLLAEAFGVEKEPALRPVMEHALESDYRVFFMHYKAGTVSSQDISSLDPSAEEISEANWGGLTGFSSEFAEAVRKAVNGSA